MTFLWERQQDNGWMDGWMDGHTDNLNALCPRQAEAAGALKREKEIGKKEKSIHPETRTTNSIYM